VVSNYTEEAVDVPSTDTASFKPAVRQEFQPFRRSRQTEFQHLLEEVVTVYLVF
jgi:hypothetical protein